MRKKELCVETKGIQRHITVPESKQQKATALCSKIKDLHVIWTMEFL
jgi:hypothetical protein